MFVYSSKDKSNYWVAQLLVYLWKRDSLPGSLPSYVFSKDDCDAVSRKECAEVLRGLVNSGSVFVLVDDASYSGDQLIDLSKELKNMIFRVTEHELGRASLRVIVSAATTRASKKFGGKAGGVHYTDVKWF